MDINLRILSLAAKLDTTADSEDKLRIIDDIRAACYVLEKRIRRRQRTNLRSSNAAARKSASSKHRLIQQLPNELLLYIFTIHNKSEHVRRNAVLMLVCQRWRQLIISTPQLWSRIEIAPHSNMRNLARCSRLVELCLKASGDRPIDVVLDFTELWNPYLKPELAVGSHIVGNTTYPRIDKVDNELAERIGDLAADSLWSHLDTLLKVLTAERLEIRDSFDFGRRTVSQMERWRSLQLTFSFWMPPAFIETILSYFSYTTPILETLEISHLDDMYNWTLEEGTMLYNESFPSLPVLKVLKTDATIDISLLRHNRQTIQQLEIRLTPRAFIYLPNYPNLHTLHLIFESLEPWSLDVPLDRITLPRLTNLTLFGDLTVELLPRFAAPNLQRLRLSCPFIVLYPKSKLFNNVRLLEWDIPFEEGEDEETRESLSVVLPQCHRLVHFTTWAAGKPSAPDPMKAMVREILTRHPLENLQTITYLRVGKRKFDDSKTSEIVTLPFD